MKIVINNDAVRDLKLDKNVAGRIKSEKPIKIWKKLYRSLKE